MKQKKNSRKQMLAAVGARGGSRTRTPFRALAPEASESTNSTTRAIKWCGSQLPDHRGARCILPLSPTNVNIFFNLFFRLTNGGAIAYNK